MKRASRNSIARLIVAVIVVLLFCVMPHLSNYANYRRAIPGHGGEILVPLYPLLALLVWECRGSQTPDREER